MYIKGLYLCLYLFIRSNLLKQTVSTPDGKPKGHFPVLAEHLKYFDVGITPGHITFKI